MTITAKQIHSFGFKYNWINRNFKHIKKPLKDGVSNVYDVNMLIIHTRSILIDRYLSKNIRQNKVSEKLLEKLLKDLYEYRTIN